jgi:hypothetical protein
VVVDRAAQILRPQLDAFPAKQDLAAGSRLERLAALQAKLQGQARIFGWPAAASDREVEPQAGA